MRKLLCSLLLTGALVAPVSHAQVIIGNGIGRDCYRVTVLNNEPKKSHERVCDSAIEGSAGNRQNLAANHVNRGILRMRMENYIGALEDYAVARRLRPKLGATYLNEGAAMIGAGRHEEAIATLKRALELDTQDADAAHYNLGLAYDLTGNVTEAYYAFKKAAELNPDWDLPQQQLERYSIVSTG